MSSIQITWDGRPVEANTDETLLDVAGRLGVTIPTLCYRKECSPSTSCLVCVVKANGKIVPSCATQAADGMTVECDTEEIIDARRTALELLISEHVGDCLAPCQFTCPAEMDIPKMLRQIQAGDLRGAIETVKRDIPLPAALGRVCPKPCEMGCRMRHLDEAVAICELKRYVADVDLASDSPYAPECAASTGKRIAILGTGPAGLSAAYYLRTLGHGVCLYEQGDVLGGRLRNEEDLPGDVLDAEIGTILALGIEDDDVHINWPTNESSLDTLTSQHDAVLLACGPVEPGLTAAWRLEVTKRGIAADAKTYATSYPAVFAAGSAVRGRNLIIRSIADGKEAAANIHDFLSGDTLRGSARPFSVRVGRLEQEELRQLQQLSDTSERVEPDMAAGIDYPQEEAARQAARCLHCDCRAPEKCQLKHWAEAYGADTKRYTAPRGAVELQTLHPDVVFEPGKCIKCGLCIQVTAEEAESVGLAFLGRGYDVQVGTPFERSLAEALGKMADRCVEVCPTAALAYKDK